MEIQFRQLFERSPDAMLVVDRAGQIAEANAQEEERCRIAADVHDDTIQMLTAANLRLYQLRRRLQDPDQLQILDKLGETLSLSLSRLRQLIFDLRPVSLEDGSPVSALREILEEMRAEAAIAYRLEDSCTPRVPASSPALISPTPPQALLNALPPPRSTTS